MTNGKANDQITDGMRHLAFSQVLAGRHVVLKHPKTATSWETRVLGRLIFSNVLLLFLIFVHLE